MNRLSLMFQLFRRSARHGRKRMTLTVAAVAWGTLSIVLLLSFGEGLKRSLQQGSRGMGEGIAVVWPGQTSKAWQGMPVGRDILLKPDDAELVRSSIPEIGAVSGEMNNWSTPLVRGRVSLVKKVTGVHPVFGEMRNLNPLPGGRFLDDLDQARKRRVVFLGDKLAKELFEEADAVGQTLLLNQTPFLVIGVMRHKTQMGMYGGPDENQAFIPIATFEVLFGRHALNELIIRPAKPELMGAARRRLQEVLGGRYRFDPEDDRVFGVWDALKSQKVTGNIAVGIQIFLGIIGALTLIIGGVGVANIMYAVVRQRTRELGIQMALGARGDDLVGPLVLEALSLTALGGLIGIGLGSLIVYGLAFIQSRMQSRAMELIGSPTFSLPLVFTTVLLLCLIGLLAGYFPARRAVTIEPARVLRNE
jgi:putative ABC transport system permease protein